MVQLFAEQPPRTGHAAADWPGVGHGELAEPPGYDHEAGLAVVVMRPHVVARLAANVVQHRPEGGARGGERDGGIVHRIMRIFGGHAVAALPRELREGILGRRPLALQRHTAWLPEIGRAQFVEQLASTAAQLGIGRVDLLLQLFARHGTKASQLVRGQPALRIRG